MEYDHSPGHQTLSRSPATYVPPLIVDQPQGLVRNPHLQGSKRPPKILHLGLMRQSLGLYPIQIQMLVEKGHNLPRVVPLFYVGS